MPAGGGALSLLSSSPAAAYLPTGAASAILVQEDGKIISAEGKSSSTLSGGTIKDLRSVRFSADGKKIAVAFGDSEPQLSVFDIGAKSWQPIADGGDAFAWSPTGEMLAYFSTGKPKTLFTLDLSNPKAKKQSILGLRAEELRLAWAGKFIWAYDKPSAFANGSLWRIDPAKKTIAPVVQDQPGLDVSLGEDWVLVFRANAGQRGGRLSLLDSSGNLIQQMAVLTLPDKCAFYKETLAASSTLSSTTKAVTSETKSYLFCSIPTDPRSMSLGALPDDYYRRDVMTKDGIYKIDLTTGGLTSLWTEEAPDMDAVDIKISGGNLYFLNRWNSGVYRLKL